MLRRTMLAGVMLLFVAAASGRASTEHAACRPAPAVAVAIDTILDVDSDCYHEPECWRELVVQLEATLNELREHEDAHEEALPHLSASKPHAQLWRLRGKLAEARDRPLNAIAYYRQAMMLADDRKATERAKALWAGLGGTEAGWAALATVDAAGANGLDEAEEFTGWETTNQPLGDDFRLEDLDGQTWTVADLTGSTTLINVWTTWCAPCRMEMPELVKLHERIDGRDDLRVLSLNVDSNPGLVAGFVKRYGLQMPVLLGREYVESAQSGATSVPQNWIVDPSGVIRSRSSGFSPERADEFVDDTLAAMETVHTGSAAAQEATENLE